VLPCNTFCNISLETLQMDGFGNLVLSLRGSGSGIFRALVQAVEVALTLFFAVHCLAAVGENAGHR
jgi:hypothetical protein